MNRLGKQRLMAVFIGLLMITSMIGFAVIYSGRSDKGGYIQFPNIVNRTLSTEEKLLVLRNGRVLIEYIYNELCDDCLKKIEMYKNFANSNEFKNYVVFSYGISNATNETTDWMFNLDGTQIDLKEIKNFNEMKKKFCEVSIIKPNICILEEI